MLEAFEPVLIRTPRETSQAKHRKNLPTTYGGVRQTCMHAEMATATSAAMAADGIGSNRISAAPRRGGEIHQYHASVGRRHQCSYKKTAFSSHVRCGNRALFVGVFASHLNTAVLGLDAETPAISCCTEMAPGTKTQFFFFLLHGRRSPTDA